MSNGNAGATASPGFDWDRFSAWLTGPIAVIGAATAALLKLQTDFLNYPLLTFLIASAMVAIAGYNAASHVSEAVLRRIFRIIARVGVTGVLCAASILLYLSLRAFFVRDAAVVIFVGPVVDHTGSSRTIDRDYVARTLEQRVVDVPANQRYAKPSVAIETVPIYPTQLQWLDSLVFHNATIVLWGDVVNEGEGTTLNLNGEIEHTFNLERAPGLGAIKFGKIDIKNRANVDGTISAIGNTVVGLVDYSEGNYSTASDAFARATATNATNFASQSDIPSYYLASIYSMRGEPQTALTNYWAAIETEQAFAPGARDGLAYLGEGRAYEELGQYQKALAAYMNAEQVQSVNMAAQLAYESLSLRTAPTSQRRQQCYADLMRLASEAADGPTNIFAQAAVQMSIGRSQYQKILEDASEDSLSPTRLDVLAQAYEANGNIPRALSTVLLALGNGPFDASSPKGADESDQIGLHLGRLLRKSGRGSDAASTFNQVIWHAEKYGHFLAVAMANAELGQYDQAIEALDKEVQRNHDGLAIEKLYGEYYTRLGDQMMHGPDSDIRPRTPGTTQARFAWKAALQHYNRVLASEPLNVQTIVDAGNVERRLGDLNAANAAFRKAAGIDPIYPTEYLAVTKAAINAGNWKRATIVVNEAKSLWPKDPQFTSLAARVAIASTGVSN